jgi:hypothetical protein
MRAGLVLTCSLAVTVVAGCGGALPVSPTTNTDPRGTGAQPPVRATLALSELSVVVSRFAQHDTVYWGYEPKFRVAETSGGTGAVITAVRVAAPFPVSPPDSIWEETSEACWRNPLRVEAGGTLEAFNIEPWTDGGWTKGGLGYCAPSLASYRDEGLPSVVITVTFTDDNGNHGAVWATIPVPQGAASVGQTAL